MIRTKRGWNKAKEKSKKFNPHADMPGKHSKSVLPKYYSHVCQKDGGADHCMQRFDDYQLPYGDAEKYEVFKDKKLGQGHFSIVYEGMSKESEDRVVVKALNPVRWKNIQREV